MTTLRVALAQVNPTVGDLPGNSDLVLDYAGRAAADGAQLVAFPEMVLTGYPVEDLALRASFQQASRDALERLAERLRDAGLGALPCVVGYLDAHPAGPRPGRPRGGPQNAAAVLHEGTVVARYAKHHLPNYGVFDEERYFVPGEHTMVVRVGGVDVALAICEDLWQDDGPLVAVRELRPGLLLVLNGSPYERGKQDTRLALCAQRAGETGTTLGYVNLVGGQDELVFDGGSMVVGTAGDVIARAPRFESHLLVVDLELPEPAAGSRALVVSDAVAARPPVRPAPVEWPDESAEVWAALRTGLRDYVQKNGFGSVVLGLSGGIDSAVVAVLACDALGADRVHGISMPSVYSSAHSKDDAARLAEATGLHYRTVPIGPMVEAFLAQLGWTGVAEENLQARVRGMTLMGISNQEGHLVLATGNKSELSVGYSTIYGDAVGGFAPIKDVLKTDVWALARWRNQLAAAGGERPPIPESSITKPPSAELRPGQLDTDSLPDYQLLDELLDAYVEQDLGAGQLVAHGFPPELVSRVLSMCDRAEYKRRQYPPGTKISSRGFGRDRRLPITSRWHDEVGAAGRPPVSRR